MNETDVTIVITLGALMFGLIAHLQYKTNKPDEITEKYLKLMRAKMDYSKIDNIVFGGKLTYPDFEDAFIESAYYDGEPMTEEQLDLVNDDSQFVYEKAFESTF